MAMKETRLIYQTQPTKPKPTKPKTTKPKTTAQLEMESFEKLHPKPVQNAPAGQTLPPSPGQKTVQQPSGTMQKTNLTANIAPQTVPQTEMQRQIAGAERQPAGTFYKDQIEQARQSGMEEKDIQSAIDARDKGILTHQEFSDYLGKLLGGTPKPETDKVLDETVDGTLPPTGAPVPTDEVKEATTEGIEGAAEELITTFDESLDVTMKTAEDRFNAENAAYNESLALQQQLAAQQQALLASGAEIQKQEAKNAYEANQAAIALQKKKVAEAYEAMQEEQKLLNTQRQIREETSLGLIYGGFGSVAANKNLEETVIRGERELMGLSKDAINKDTEFQNQVVELNKAYELDLRKIEQWKVEESNRVYASLASYVQDIKNNKAMAAVERASAINQAVADYNTKVAEISASVAQTKYNLSIELMNRADRLKQQDIQNQITKAQEQREVKSFEYEQNRNKINDARTDLDLVLGNYFKEDYDKLPPDVLAQIDKLEKEGNLPTGASKQIMQMAKEADVKAGDVVKEFTDQFTGETTAIKYNFDTGKVETMKLGQTGQQTPEWEMDYNPDTGAYEERNLRTGDFRSNTPFTGELPAVFGEGGIGGWCGVYASKVSTAPALGDSWPSKKSKITHYENPGIGDKLVFPAGVQTDGSGWGHVAVVIGFNPATGIIDVVESNRDGRQKTDKGTQGIVTKGTYNIKDIVNQGGGFVAGSLKEPYNSALMKESGDGGSQVDQYVQMVKDGTKYTEVATMIKNVTTDKDMEASLLNQFYNAIGSPQEGSAPEWQQSLPVIGDVFKNIKTEEPSIIEQEIIDKEKKGNDFSLTDEDGLQ